MQTAEARSQESGARIVTACLKSDPQATPQRHAVRGSDLSPCGVYRRLLLSLNDRAYGMPSRLQDAAGSRNRCKDAALEAVGIPLATEFRDSCSRR